MRIILMFIAFFPTVTGFSQIVEDFEAVVAGGIPSGWTQVSLASDGGYGVTTDLSGLNFFVPSHTSYIGTSDGNCDCNKSNEQLISAPVNVPVSGVSHVQFEYVLGDLNGEFARFGISIDGGISIIDLGVLNATNNNPNVQTDWSKVIFPLSGYEGQTVNFVWTYDDGNDWSSGLAIDDLALVDVPITDMEMVAVTHPSIVAQGSVTISGVVRNLGADIVSSYEVVWDAGSGPESYVVTPSIPLSFDALDEFSHNVPLDVLAGGIYNVDVYVNMLGDADATNDMISDIVSVVTSVPSRRVVGEDRTGEWCGWCPRSAKYLAEMELSNHYDFIGIAVHNQDVMAVTGYDAAIDAYVPGGLPISGVDRVLIGDPSEFSLMHAQRISTVAPGELYVTMTYDGTDIDVEISCEFMASLNGDYRLATVLVEDNVLGDGQVNYYSTGTLLVMPNIGSMANYDFSAGSSTIVPFYHDYVARAVGGNEINGEANSLPSSILAGETFSYTYNIPQDASWDMSNVNAIAMLIDGTTGEILNGQKDDFIVNVEEGVSKDLNLKVAPNPIIGWSDFIIELETLSSVEISVVNSVGQTVLSMPESNVLAGSHKIAMNFSKVSAGVYFAIVKVNNDVRNVKISVVK